MDHRPKKPFRFKQFEIQHDRCAMKVNTDGVLLGAWADVANVKNALDVGTGSGVIALMLAQRGVARVDAVEIDTGAATQAGENFNASLWAGRLKVHPMGLQQFGPSIFYDLVISNPPYFSNAYKTPIATRNLARHNDSLPLFYLMAFAAQWLSATGRLALILPYEMETQATEQANKAGLFVRGCCHVKGTVNGDTKRVLMEFGREQGVVTTTTLAIETAPLQHTPEYRALTRDFYLAF